MLPQPHCNRLLRVSFIRAKKPVLINYFEIPIDLNKTISFKVA